MSESSRAALRSEASESGGEETLASGNRPMAGAVYLLIASTGFALMAGSVKAAGEVVGTFTVVLARSLVILLVLAPVMRWRRIPLLTRSHPLLYLRCLFGTCTLLFYYFALQRAPFAEVVVLVNTAPLFMPILGILFLGERPKPLLIVLQLVGFAGVVAIMGPQLEQLDWGLLFALIAAFSTALAMTCLKKLTARERPMTLVFTFALWTAIVGLPWGCRVAPSDLNAAWVPLVLTGVFAFVGQLFITQALACSAAGVVMLLSYFGVFLAFALGLLIWGETASTRSVCGALLVLAACGLTSWWAPRLVEKGG